MNKKWQPAGLLFLLFLLPASQARALPPPMSEDEMMQAADLVVDAEGVEIVCEGPPIADPQKITTTYLSTLFPSFSYKGGLPNSLQIRGFSYEWIETEPVGGWHQVPVPVGWVGKLYLSRENDGTYMEVWWNAMIEDDQQSHPQRLPSCEEVQVDGGVSDGGGPSDAEAEPDGTMQDDAGGASTARRDGCDCQQAG